MKLSELAKQFKPFGVEFNGLVDPNIKFIWNGEADYMMTFSKASLQNDNDGEPYILLDDLKKS